MVTETVAPGFVFHDEVEGYLTPEEGLTLYLLAKEADVEYIVELGSYKGRSAVCLAQADKHLLCVDHFDGEASIQGARFDHIVGNYRGEFWANIERYVPKAYVEVMERNTVDAACRFVGKVDLVFVDAAHDYESVKADFEAWAPHVRPGGRMAFHDAYFPGVQRLLNEVLEASTEWERYHAAGSIAVYRKRDCHGED